MLDLRTEIQPEMRQLLSNQKKCTEETIIQGVLYVKSIFKRTTNFNDKMTTSFVFHPKFSFSIKEKFKIGKNLSKFLKKFEARKPIDCKEYFCLVPTKCNTKVIYENVHDVESQQQ